MAGTAIFPVVGTVIGAGIGALLGGLTTALISRHLIERKPLKVKVIYTISNESPPPIIKIKRILDKVRWVYILLTATNSNEDEEALGLYNWSIP